MIHLVDYYYRGARAKRASYIAGMLPGYTRDSSHSKVTQGKMYSLPLLSRVGVLSTFKEQRDAYESTSYSR